MRGGHRRHGNADVPVARPVFGQDCLDIAACTFAPANVEFSADVEEVLYRNRAQVTVERTPLSWFGEARSQADALRLAYGEEWRIDLIPSTTPDLASMFLLTHRLYGHRLLIRMRRIHYRTWAFKPTEATGRLGRLTGRRTRKTLCEDRRAWLADEVRLGGTAAVDLLELVRLAEARVASTVTGDADRAQDRAVAQSLVEVWLAETAASEEVRATTRAMVALGTPLSTFMAATPARVGAPVAGASLR